MPIVQINGPGVKTLAEDVKVFDALKGIADYTPADEKSGETIQVLFDKMTTMQAQQTQAEAALKTLRDNVTSVEWSFHNAIQAAKNIVRGKYGKDSNEVQALGLKKVSEYKRRKRKAAADGKKAA